MPTPLPNLGELYKHPALGDSNFAKTVYKGLPPVPRPQIIENGAILQLKITPQPKLELPPWKEPPPRPAPTTPPPSDLIKQLTQKGGLRDPPPTIKGALLPLLIAPLLEFESKRNGNKTARQAVLERLREPKNLVPPQTRVANGTPPFTGGQSFDVFYVVKYDIYTRDAPAFDDGTNNRDIITDAKDRIFTGTGRLSLFTALAPRIPPDRRSTLAGEVIFQFKDSSGTITSQHAAISQSGGLIEYRIYNVRIRRADNRPDIGGNPPGLNPAPNETGNRTPPPPVFFEPQLAREIKNKEAIAPRPFKEPSPKPTFNPNPAPAPAPAPAPNPVPPPSLRGFGPTPAPAPAPAPTPAPESKTSRPEPRDIIAPRQIPSTPPEFVTSTEPTKVEGFQPDTVTPQPRVTPQPQTNPRTTPRPQPQPQPRPESLPQNQREIDDRKDKENFDRMSALIIGLPLAIAASTAVRDAIKTTTKEGTCELSMPDQCIDNAVKRNTDGVNNNVNAKDVENKGILASILGQFAALSAQIALVLAKIKTFAESTVVMSAINALTLITTIHNAAMLSRDIGTTLIDAIGNGLGIFGLQIKNADTGATIGLSEALGTGFANLLKGIVGTENYTLYTEKIATANRIYQAGINVAQSVQSLADSARSLNEQTGNNVGKIGNALKLNGLVRENEFPYMSENNNQQNSFMNRLEQVQQGVSTISSITGEVVSVQQQVKDFQDNRKAFEKELAEKPPKPAIENEPIKVSEDTKKIESLWTINDFAITKADEVERDS